MKKNIQKELERVKQLSPTDFVREYAKVDRQFLSQESLSSQELKALAESLELLLAGSTDVQLLALAADNMRKHGSQENIEASAGAIEALWMRRAALVSEYGLPRVNALTAEAALDIARKIHRTEEENKEIRKGGRLTEQSGWLRGHLPKDHSHRA